MYRTDIQIPNTYPEVFIKITSYTFRIKTFSNNLNNDKKKQLQDNTISNRIIWGNTRIMTSAQGIYGVTFLRADYFSDTKQNKCFIPKLISE